MAKNKISQKDRILKHLREHGTVSRNSAIRGEYGEFITRLGAIMHDLKNEGINFETVQYKKPNDFVYKLLDKPKMVEVLRVGDKIVGKRVIW